MLQPRKNKETWKQDKEFLNSWYANRKLPNPKLNQDYQNDKQLYLDQVGQLPDPRFVNQIDEDNTQGIYDRITGDINILNTADPLVYNHEGTHKINYGVLDTQSSLNNFTNVGNNILPVDQIDNQWIKDNYKDISNYQEVIGRLNAYRQLHNLKPDQEITPELIKANRDAYKAGQIEFEDNTDQLYKLFDDKGLSETLNSVVSNTMKQDPDVQIAELGGIIKGKMKKKKYELGSYVTNPATDLAENQIAIARAQEKADNNLWTKGLDLFGNLAMQYGSSLMSSPQGAQAYGGGETATTGFTGFLNKNAGTISKGANTAGNLSQLFALGGIVGQAPINAEGGEILETPMGDPVELQGASHANGGIDMVVPIGTEIYSKKLKGPDGKTMADRKKARERSEAKLNKLLEKAPGDRILKDTQDRLVQANGIVEDSDMQTMELAQMFNALQGYFADGGVVDPIDNVWNTLTNQSSVYGIYDSFKNNKPFKTQDVIGLVPSGTAQILSSTLEIADKERQNMKQFNTNKNRGRKLEPRATPTNLKVKDTYALGGPVGPGFPKPAPAGYEYPSIFNNFGDMTQAPEVDLTGLNYPIDRTTNLTLKDFEDPSTTKAPSVNATGILDFLGNATNFSLGDAIGLAGQYKSTFDPMKNTLANRAGDTPNINPYENYGKDGLAKLDQSKQYVNQIRDQQLKALQLATNANVSRGRNSARGINTMRALDIASALQAQGANSQIYQQFAQAMQGILSQEAGFENQQDAMVMQGRATQDANDRADRDNFFSQMARDISTRGTGIQQIGKTVNDIKERNVTGNIMNQMYANFGIDAMSGNIKSKATQEINKNPNFYSGVPKESFNKIISGLNSKYFIRNDKLYDAQGNELDKTTLNKI